MVHGCECSRRMSDLKFHPLAFSFIWDLPRLTPEKHIAAFDKMIAEWLAELEQEKADMERHNGTSDQGDGAGE